MEETKKRIRACQSAIDYAEELGEGGYDVIIAIAAAYKAGKAASAKEKNSPESKPDPETEKAG